MLENFVLPSADSKISFNLLLESTYTFSSINCAHLKIYIAFYVVLKRSKMALRLYLLYFGEVSINGVY